MRIALTGEALIDFTASEAGTLAFLGHEGGSPLHTAVACARLGQPTGFLTQLSTDLFGERLMRFLERNGVDTRLILRSNAPSTLAFVERTPQTNRYAFYTRGSADATWAPEPLPQLPAECRFLHFGSISLLQEPAATRIAELVTANVGRRVIVFDPNVRPSLIPDMAAYREHMTDWLAMADLVKLSDEDAELLAPAGRSMHWRRIACRPARTPWSSRAAARAPRSGARGTRRSPWRRPASRWSTPSARATPSRPGSRWRCSRTASSTRPSSASWATRPGAR